MAFITLAGSLKDPNSDLSIGDQVRFTQQSTTGETLEGAVSVVTISVLGTYSVNLQYGLVLVEYRNAKNPNFRSLGIKTVNANNPATSIPELLTATVPVSSADLIAFQTILADAVTAENGAVTARDVAVAASIIQYQTFSELLAISETVDYKQFTVAERANAAYTLQPSGYVALAGDATLANSRVAALQIDGEANIRNFGFNPANTSTQNISAWNLAITRTKFILIPAGDYNFNDDLLIRGQNTNKFEYFSVRGEGRSSTRLLQQDNSKNTFVLEKSALNDQSNQWLSGSISSLSIIYSGAQKADDCTALKSTSCFNVLFSDITIEGATKMWSTFGCGHIVYDNIHIENGQRPVSQGPLELFKFSNNQNIYRSSGIYMSNIEQFGAPVADVGFLLEAVDGLYVSNCHFNTCIKKVKISMDNVELRDVVKQIFFSNVYFDGNTDLQGTALEEVIFIEASNSPQAVVDGLYFSNVFAREGTTFFAFSPTNTAGLLSVRNIKVGGCHIRGMSSFWFNLGMVDNRELNVIRNVSITGNIFDDAPLATPTDNLNCIAIAGKNITFTNNTIKGQWVDGVAAPILVTDAADQVLILGNVLDTNRSGTAGNKSIVISSSATNVIQANNLPVE